MANDSTVDPPRRRPLLSNTLRTLSRIYSLFPEENSFSQLADFNYTPDVWKACNVPQKSLLKPTSDDAGNNSGSRSEREDFMQLECSGNVESNNPPIRNGSDKDGDAKVLYEGNGSKRSEMIVDELNGAEETETVNKVASNEDTHDHTSEADNLSKGLLGIETLLMDDLDDIDILQMSDKDINNFDILDDFGTFTIGDGLGNDSLPVESTGNDKMIRGGNLKEDMVVEDKGKDMEAEKLTVGGDGVKCGAHVHKELEKAGSSEVGNQLGGSTPQDVGRKEPKVYRSKGLQGQSEIGSLIFLAQKRKNEGETILGVKGVDSVEKEHKSGSAEKKKTKKGKKVVTKDVKSGKSKRKSLDGEGSNGTNFGGGDSTVVGKTDKLNLLGNQDNMSGKLVGKRMPTKCVKIKYNREQLIHLRELAAVPADILKAVKEISVQVHSEKQNPAVEEGTVSGVTEKKKRGSSPETRKERKKERRKKKRAEMDKKLGVKRLKLGPNLKPKVVPHCRHYLKGRCQEGEKCKFSHEVIPLTKSKPCSHSARNSCMKGDECPYDHQLSKYPCNNIVETGFCSRGDSCLFSHKISGDGSDAQVGVTRNEICSLAELDKSKKSVHPVSNKPKKAPKGLNFMSVGKPSLDDNVDFSSPLKASNKANPSPLGSDLVRKLQGSVVSTGGSQMETKNGNDSDNKLKGVNSETLLASLGGPGKSTQGTAQRALLSTLAFASKFESGIKMSSAASTEVKKPMKASAVFELLYGGSKEKQ